MKQLLLCVDLSPVTERVVAFVAAMAGAGAPRVHVLHVADPEPAFVGFGTDTPEHRDQVATSLRETHRACEAIESGLRAAGLEVDLHVVRGSVADTILERASALFADAIVVGSNGHNRVRSLFVGSVTDALLRRATMPVIVVPAARDA